MNTKKLLISILSLILCLCMLVPVMVACGNNDTPADGQETKAGDKESKNGETQGEESETEFRYVAHYPAGTDLKKAELRILTWEYIEGNPWIDVDFAAETFTGDIVNDAAYSRMKSVEEDINCTIIANPDCKYGDSANRLQTLVSSGTDAYDVAVIPARAAFNSLAEQGYLVNWNSIDSLELDEPWWDQGARDGLSMGGKLFMMDGDISILYRKSLRVYYFNKGMHRDAGLENFYELVKNKEWTIEKMVEAALSVSADDGNGIHDENDVYGLIATVDTITTGLIGAGVRYTTKDEDDYPEFCFYNDDTIDVWSNYIEILYDKECCVLNNASDRGYNTTNMFLNDQVLMSNCELHNLASFRKMSTDFGILPTPMADDLQEQYLSTVNPVVCGCICIPTTNVNLQTTALILDALGAESKNVLTPAYYDIYLTGQTARDEESTVCLDIIFNNVTWDIGNIYNWNNIATFTQQLVRSYNRSFTSEYEKIKDSAQTRLTETIEKFMELE